MSLEPVYLRIYYQFEGSIIFKDFNIKEIVERNSVNGFKKLLKDFEKRYFENNPFTKFIRAEILTKNLTFIYPLIGYKSISEIVNNLDIGKTLELLSEIEIQDKVINLFIVDRINKVRVEFYYVKNPKDKLFYLYRVKVYPKII